MRDNNDQYIGFYIQKRQSQRKSSPACFLTSYYWVQGPTTENTGIITSTLSMSMETIEMIFRRDQTCEFRIDGSTKWSGSCTIPSSTIIKDIFFTYNWDCRTTEKINYIDDIELFTIS